MPPGPGWITTVAARQNYYEIDYDMWSRKDVDAYALSGKSMPFNNTAQLSAALGQASANLSVGVTASNLRTDMELSLIHIWSAPIPTSQRSSPLGLSLRPPSRRRTAW